MSANDHRSRAGAAVGALAGAGLLGYMLPALAGAWPALRRPLGIEDRTASGRGYALTFDDGPHARGTPAMLEILGRAGVAATFFMVGEQVQRDPGLAREVRERGHAIALHCHRHRNLLRLTPRQVREDILRALETIESATGVSPRIYRPPYGILNSAALSLARGRGWRTMLWTDWGRDWEPRASAESIAERVTVRAGEGSVLLLHDADDYSASGSWERTAAALPRVLDVLGTRGLQPTMP
jgi:peptidoglycan/xylan/chitin deacetylase (PgdA/CDA1 family)